MSHVIVFQAIDERFKGQWEGSFTIDRKGRKCLVAQMLGSDLDDREFQVDTYSSLDDSYVVTTDESSCANLQYVENIERALEIIAADATATCTVHVPLNEKNDDVEFNAKCNLFRTLSRCMLADALANHETKTMDIEMNDENQRMQTWNIHRTLICYETGMELWSREEHPSMYVLEKPRLKSFAIKGFTYPDGIEGAYLALVSGFIKYDQKAKV